MKIQKELVTLLPGQSFKVFSPTLSKTFLWHYHPEIELLYVDAFTGIRHVGQHISSYMESDLVLIGSKVPHLNFDYGIQTQYHQIVVQLKEGFLRSALRDTPEFSGINKLFDQSALGLAFHGETKKLVGQKMQEMQDQTQFSQLLSLLDIFRILANSEEVTQLNDRDTSIKLFLNDKIRMGTVYDYIHQRYNRHPDVNEVAEAVHLSTPAFCRYFKNQTKMTFTEFVNHYRINQAKTLFLHGQTVTEACFEIGFENLAHFSRVFTKIVGENPSSFRKKHFVTII